MRWRPLPHARKPRRTPARGLALTIGAGLAVLALVLVGMLLVDGPARAAGGATHLARASGRDDPTLWYLTRGAATTAYLLLAVVVGLGTSLGVRAFEGVMRGWRVLDLHQTLTLVMLAFVGLHLTTLVLDPFKPFAVAQVVWPFAETYRPVAVALGVLSLYLLVVVTITSYVRSALSTSAWHGIHLTSYVAFVLLTIHGLLTGTDSQTPWMLGLYFGAGAMVLWLTLARIYFAVRHARAKKGALSRT